MKVSAQMKWIDGFQFVGRVGNGPAIILDNPEGGSGPSPMQVFLMGIAGCSGMDVVSILKKKRSTFKDLQVNITGDRKEDHFQTQRRPSITIRQHRPRRSEFLRCRSLSRPPRKI